MIDDTVVLRIERIRDDAESLKSEMRARYSSGSRPVRDTEIRERATKVAERWLVEIGSREDIGSALSGTVLADRNVQFQRLLTYAERTTQRLKYDQALTAILKNFRAEVIVPLKARRHVGAAETETVHAPAGGVRTVAPKVAFVGQSFADADKTLNETVARALTALGLSVLTGEKPKAEQVARKVKDRIDKADLFVGIFSRRDKLEGRNEWAPSPWVVDEKAYALARQKKLLLLREAGVSSIGGLQGDYEYISFDRDLLADLVIKLIEALTSDE